MPDDIENVPHLKSATLLAIFGICLKIGVLSFGGGLSGWLHQEFVENKKWISEDDFASSLAISQMLPGANVVNLVICMGEQLQGPLGAIVGAVGFLLGPFFAVIALSVLVDHVSNLGSLDAVMAGVAAAATGLLIVICWKGARRAARHRSGLFVIGGVAIAVGIFKLPLLAVVAVAAPLSIALSWRRDMSDA